MLCASACSMMASHLHDRIAVFLKPFPGDLFPEGPDFLPFHISSFLISTLQACCSYPGIAARLFGICIFYFIYQFMSIRNTRRFNMARPHKARGYARQNGAPSGAPFFLSFIFQLCQGITFAAQTARSPAQHRLPHWTVPRGRLPPALPAPRCPPRPAAPQAASSSGRSDCPRRPSALLL